MVAKFKAYETIELLKEAEAAIRTGHAFANAARAAARSDEDRKTVAEWLVRWMPREIPTRHG